MIETLHDLTSYTAALAARVPGIAERVKIESPGLSVEAVSSLSALGLPPAYARCLVALDLFGVAVGHFAMWPGSVSAGSMPAALLGVNQGDQEHVQEARKGKLLVVAQEEANLVCVGQSDAEVPDTVYLLDVMRSSSVHRYCIADDFEKFLLLAGNLHEIGREFHDDTVGGIAKMVDCCHHFGCAVGQIVFWAARATVANL